MGGCCSSSVVGSSYQLDPPDASQRSSHRTGNGTSSGSARKSGRQKNSWEQNEPSQSRQKSKSKKHSKKEKDKEKERERERDSKHRERDRDRDRERDRESSRSRRNSTSQSQSTNSLLRSSDASGNGNHAYGNSANWKDGAAAVTASSASELHAEELELDDWQRGMLDIMEEQSIQAYDMDMSVGPNLERRYSNSLMGFPSGFGAAIMYEVGTATTYGTYYLLV